MPEVEAHVYYWTQFGMRQVPPQEPAQGYVRTHEVTRLLEEAHRRGRDEAAAEFREQNARP